MFWKQISIWNRKSVWEGHFLRSLWISRFAVFGQNGKRRLAHDMFLTN